MAVIKVCATEKRANATYPDLLLPPPPLPLPPSSPTPLPPPFFVESWFISTPLEMRELTYWTQFLDSPGPFITWFYVLHSKEAVVRFWFSCYQCQIRSLKYLGILLPHCGISGVKGCGNLMGRIRGKSLTVFDVVYCRILPQRKQASSQ